MGEKHFGFELPQILIFAWLIVLYLLLTPLLIFSVHRYIQVLHHPFIYCRRPKLVVTCCILTIIYSSIYSPILLIISEFTWINANLSLETHFLLNSLPLLFISLHFSIRFYQVYYDLNYNSSVADQIWSQAINTKASNFYIKNRESYGKPRFQYIIFSIFMLILNSIIIFQILVFGSSTIYIAQILIIFILIIHLIPLIIIFKKLNSFLDNIKLRKELLWNVILLFLSIIVITIHSILYISNIISSYSVVTIIISIFYLCICCIQTLYIILQPETQSEDLLNINHKYSLTSNSTPQYDSTPTQTGSFPVSTPEIASRMSAHSKSSRSFHHTHISGDVNSTTPKLKSSHSYAIQSIRLNHIFKNENTFKLFIRHLAKEYCIENALFLFESQQFKKQLNTIETQLGLMNSRASNSFSNNNNRIIKKRKNLLLSVPSTVKEEEQKEEKEQSDEQTPVSPVSDSNENKYDVILSNISVNKSNGMHVSQNSSHNYYGTSSNKILSFLPFELIPTSQIIEKYQNDFEKTFIKLYEKYIDWKTSSFEINISGTHRNVLHSIYIRITYQLLMEERKELLMQQTETKRKSNFLNIQNGFVVDKNEKNKNEKPIRNTQIWQSRKTIVNALKATITKNKQQQSNSKLNGITKGINNIEKKVEIKEVINALTLAEIDIIKNLNDSLRRFKSTIQFQNWFQENINNI